MTTTTKELLEVIKMAEIIGVGVAKIASDGKINMQDLPVAMDLLSKAQEITEGFKGLGAIPAEIKDLSVEELRDVVKNIIDVYTAIKNATVNEATPLD